MVAALVQKLQMLSRQRPSGTGHRMTQHWLFSSPAEDATQPRILHNRGRYTTADATQEMDCGEFS